MINSQIRMIQHPRNLALRPAVSSVENVTPPRSETSNAATPRIFEWLFLAFIATIPLMQVGIDFPQGTGTIADLLFAVTLVVGAIPIFTAATRRWNAVYVCLSAYLIASLASAVFSDAPQKSLTRLPIDVYMVLLAVVALNAVSSLQAFRRIATAWMVGTAATIGAGLFGIALFYTGRRPSWQGIVLSGYGSLPPGNYPRVHGLFLNMNMCCDYLIVSFVMLLLCHKLGWVKLRVFVALILGICITAGFTVSPGIGGLLLAAGIWFWRHPGRKSALKRSILAAGITCALAFWVACFGSPVNSGERTWRVSFLNCSLEPSSRLLCWGAAYKIWITHPLLGRGTGLDIPCPAYRAASGETQHLLDAHNMYLNTLATKGAVGLCALLSIFVVAMYPPWHLRIPPDHEAFEIYKALRVAIICAFLYGGLSGSFEHTRHLWVLVGLLAGARELAGRMILGQHDGPVQSSFLHPMRADAAG